MPALPPVERLIASLRRLPGIGEKSATRLAFYLLSAPAPQVEELADAIARLKKEVVLCEECFDLTAASPCTLCRDPKRDATLLCVVEEPADRAAVERSGGFSRALSRARRRALADRRHGSRASSASRSSCAASKSERSGR